MAKVLLIEDDDVMLSLLTTLLEMEGFQVSSVNEQDNTVDVIRAVSPDIVLLDVHLRMKSGVEIDGFELLQRIRQEDDLLSLKVIMSSGMDFREKGLESGANAFILKPYMPNDLIKLIKQTCNCPV